MKFKKSNIPVILIVLITLCIVGGMIFVLYKIRTTEPNWVITDISQYSEIRGQWYNEALFGHFPSGVPTNATEVHMLYSPPFLQKGLLFQLCLKLPADEIKRLQAEYGRIVLQKWKEKPYLIRSYPLSIYTNDKPEGEMLPSGYEIIVLDSETKDQGNHGYAYGVAINSLTSEILYWAETW